MKWFQHQSNAHRDFNVEPLIDKYGAEGYGLFWFCAEMVAEKGDEYYTIKDGFWKLYLQKNSKVATERIEDILEEMNKCGLIEYKDGSISIPKLEKYSDDYTRRKIRTVSEQCTNSVRTVSDKVPKEERRGDKIRGDKRRREELGGSRGNCATRFTPPTIEQVMAYCKERNNTVNPQRFVDFYMSKGWRVGNQPMKDWKAAVRTWEQRDTQNAKPKIANEPRSGLTKEQREKYNKIKML